MCRLTPRLPETDTLTYAGKENTTDGVKLFLVILSFAFALCRLDAQTNVWQPTKGHTQIPIWPGAAPDALPLTDPEIVTNRGSLVAGKPWLAVQNVSQPTMIVYPPKGKNAGVAVVVFPGGGYGLLAIDLEGTEICDWLTSKGITAVLAKYRVPTPKTGPYGESALALEDAQRTLRLVRARAAEWHIDPHKIGVIGFSAGGHLVAATSTQFDQRSHPPVDKADEESCRPDFGIALYPGHLWDKPDEPSRLNPHVTVTSNTPPQFIVQAENDPVDNVNNSLAYYIALKNAGVPAELHLYAEGGHAFALRPSNYPITGWPQLAEKWLQTIGMISK